MASPITTDSQSSLIQGLDSVALQDPRSGAVSMTDMSLSPVTAMGRALGAVGRSPWDARQRRDHDQQDEGRGQDRGPALKGQRRAVGAGKGRLLIAHARLAFL